MKYSHKPVFSSEVIKYFAPQKNQNYIDCTFGLGGHSRELLKKTGPKGKILAIDQDEEVIDEAQKIHKKFKDRIIYVCDNFRNINKIVRDENFQGVSGIFLDLGLGSWQIDNDNRGISFKKENILDMRLGSDNLIKARDVINNYTEKQIANLFFEYGDVIKSRKFANRIINFRKIKRIENVNELIDAIGSNNPKILAPIFQALRIEVNQELESLILALPQALEILAPCGKLIVISYHSGEDRIVKNFFRANKDKLKIITKKPDIPTDKEKKENSRSRSAKLRVAEKV